MRVGRTAWQMAKGRWQMGNGLRRGFAAVLLPFAICHLPCRPLFAEGPADPHFQAGLAYERLGRYDEAYTELQLAFALNPDDARSEEHTSELQSLRHLV